MSSGEPPRKRRLFEYNNTRSTNIFNSVGIPLRTARSTSACTFGCLRSHILSINLSLLFFTLSLSFLLSFCVFVYFSVFFFSLFLFSLLSSLLFFLSLCQTCFPSLFPPFFLPLSQLPCGVLAEPLFAFYCLTTRIRWGRWEENDPPTEHKSQLKQ